MLTGFVGKLYLDGRRATVGDALSLAQCMSLLPGSKNDTNICGALAVAAANANKEQLEARPNILVDGYYVLVGSGSVYNRDGLIKTLESREGITDLHIMWKAWLKWGKDAPLYLDGDWMFAAYDCRKEELLLARSWGHSSLYFYQGNSFLAFATHPMLLTSLPGVTCEPDINTITHLLCALPVSANSACWKGITQLQPASKMEVCRGKANEHIWWRPSQVEKIEFKKEQDIIERFVSLYSSAVKKRLRTSKGVGATLSSGLDSTSVSILAARELEPYGKELHSWTSVPYYPDEAFSYGRWMTDESSLAVKAITGIKNIKHNLVDTPDANPIDSLLVHILRTGRPQGAVANLYWIDSILNLALDSGCGVLLTGQFGNSTVSWSPNQISLIPKSKYYPNISWKKYLSLVKAKMIKNLRHLKHNINDFGLGKQSGYPVINQKYVLSKAFKRSIHDVRNMRPTNHASMAEVHMGILDTWYHISLWSGVEVRDPTIDVKLTEFLLSLPDNVFFRDNLNRRVIRLGMQDILPDEVRLNKRRGQQASDIVPRVRQFGEQAEKAVAYIEASSLAGDLLNILNMKQVLERIRTGETGFEMMKDCSRVLLPGLSAGLFLASFDTDFNLITPLCS